VALGAVMSVFEQALKQVLVDALQYELAAQVALPQMQLAVLSVWLFIDAQT